MKEKIDFVFIVLVYRNVEDIVDLLESIKSHVSNYKTIVVNNYYDDVTKTQFEQIAEKYQCDFINCENRGYGAGNNAGIRLAIKKYDFKYLIISNPDIVIKHFPEEQIKQYPDGVLGCKIYNLAHKNQNPMLAKNSHFATKMLYRGLKKDSKASLFVGKCINRLERDIYRFFLDKRQKDKRKIYQTHGSFLILSNSVIKVIGAPYDEEMFLFGEEGYLAYLLEQKKIPTFYCPEVEVLHKEDGSMKFRNNINEESVKASIYFFEKYYFHLGEKY